MDTTRHLHHEQIAADALLDQIEQELLALTTAPLECRADAPPQCVDEFADDFFSCWSRPPGYAAGPDRRAGLG
jgi:hypothetical protein